MQAIVTTLVNIGAYLLGIAQKIMKAAFDVLWDAICWLFDQVLTFAVTLAGTVDVSAFSGAVGAWGSLPSEILNMLGLIGFGYCMGIIFAAIMIRLTLQLIPFTRLGS